jgi:hypothetical protein
VIALCSAAFSPSGAAQTAVISAFDNLTTQHHFTHHCFSSIGRLMQQLFSMFYCCFCCFVLQVPLNLLSSAHFVMTLR